ncbi:hypothetical protein L4X28_11890, partial [Phocaeicola vulgatus]|uniref:hypothetical protein n=1 Tax=Phocaeicola vulgatus TaxID=821 RepID=UPI001F42C77E
HYTYPMVAQFSTGILAHFSISIYTKISFCILESFWVVFWVVSKLVSELVPKLVTKLADALGRLNVI